MREWLAEVEERLRAANLDGAAERDIAEELAQHLEDRFEELRGSGRLSDADARAHALAELGDADVLARRVRAAVDVRPEPLPIGRPTLGGMASSVWSDIVFGARMLVRAPLYTMITVLVMALGIGANTVIFIVVNSVLLQPPRGVVEPDRLAAVYTSDYSGPRYGSNSYPDVQALREAQAVFDDVAAFSLQTFVVVGDGWTARGLGEFVSSNYFAALGVQPAAGRFFMEEEADLGATSAVAVISHDMWQRHFGGSAAAIGSRIFVKREPFTVIGVAPADFSGSLHGLRALMWLPLSSPRTLTGVDMSHRGNRGLTTRARLRAGVTVESAQRMLDVVAARLHGEFPDDWTDINNQSRVFTIVPESQARVPRGMRNAVVGFLGMLTVAVLIVLLIACTNVANLTLSRASSRRAEMGVRIALGATRGRIVRHLLSESVLLALAGGVAGVVLAVWLIGLLNNVRPPGLHVNIDVSMDLRMLMFATLFTLATGILFGLAPALQASRAPAPLLKDDGRSTRTRLRHALIVVQVAASLVLLIAGGLFLRTMRAVQSIETGYITDNIVIASFDLGTEGYTIEQAAAFYDELQQRASAFPGVASLTLAREVPLGMGWSRRGLAVEEYRPAEGEDMEVLFNGVGAAYFETMGIELRRGRTFTAADRQGAPPVVIVSEAFVRRFWPDGNAIGKRVALRGPDAPPAEVVGVALDAKYRTLDDAPQPYLYFPYAQEPTEGMTLLVRAAGDPALLVSALREEIRAFAPSLPPPSVHTFRQHLRLAMLPQQIAAILLSALGLLAVTIALVGLYGIVAFDVAQRAREFGIRMALGAAANDVRRLVLANALRLVGIGILCGAPIAIAGALLIRAFLMVPPVDPVAFLGVPVLLVASAVVASYVPARRATIQNPAETLRAQ